MRIAEPGSALQAVAGLLRRNRRVCKRAGAAIYWDHGSSVGNRGSLVRHGFTQRRRRGEGVAQALRHAGGGLSIPNLITLGRILLVPIVVWAITLGEMRVAFALFLAAGISDAVDGFLAKRFHMKSELGAYLDPLADKALIVSIYVSLGIVGMVPIFLVILVVSRDIMIVSAFLLAWLVGRPMPVRPLLVSKANTVAQILLAILILAEHAFGFDFGFVSRLTMAAVALLTLLSIAFYLREWVRHMNSFGAGH
jgi:cardiolipin synthase (CMP-forming)